MRKLLVTGWMAACTVACALAYVGPESVAVAPDGKTLYVTGTSCGSLLTLDVASGKPGKSWNLNGIVPTGVAVAGDGFVFVTAVNAQGVGRIFRFQRDGKLVVQAEGGHSPMAPVVSADGKTLYVANRFDHSVTALDAATLKTTAAFAVSREPVGLALGAGGKLLFAANHLPFARAVDAIVASSVSVIDLTAKSVKNVSLPNGSTGVRGICASPDGKTVYVTHTFGRYQLPTTQLERGWMNTAGLSVLDGTTGTYINTVLLDDVDLGAANPWGVTVSADGGKIVVNHAGTREISVIDAAALRARLEKVAKGEKVTEVSHSADDVPNDLSFLVTIRRRIKLPGDGPRGIAMIGNRVYSALYFADTLSVVDVSEVLPRPGEIALGPKVDLSKDRTRRGEMLWNDASMCFQQWQSCASCHPDARSDALNWDLLNDGIGNPKQSKNLVYCHLTPPTMITGIRPDMQACNRKGITYIQFVVRPEEDGLCLDAYVSSLKPVPSPYLVNGKLSDAAKRGEALFNGKAECALCHSLSAKGPGGEGLFTDKQKHNMKLGVGNETDREFDTPTLAECWRTAPYLYDGRAVTVEDVLTTANTADTHGSTKQLSPQEIKDLAEYVKSL